MKDDSFLSHAMDLARKNASCNSYSDGGNKCTNGSHFIEGEAFESKQSGNVNSNSSQWPLRHNNDNEQPETHNSYSCNGLRQAKEPRYTCAGRISRIPSRYLDTDLDTADGSARNDTSHESRLKIKRSRRRRKQANNTSKLLLNGFTDHQNALLLSVVDTDVERSKGEQNCLAEFPDVFQDSSPISNDTISHATLIETQDNMKFHPVSSLTDKRRWSETCQACPMKGEAIGNVEHFCSWPTDLQSGCCDDISCKNKIKPRFESLLESNSEPTTATEDVNQPAAQIHSKTPVNTACKRKKIHEDSMNDSPPSETFVSPKRISKDCQVSCAFHNNSTTSLLKRENCVNCKDCSKNLLSASTVNTANNENRETQLSEIIANDIESKLLTKKRLGKTSARPRKKLAKHHKLLLKDSKSDNHPSEVDGLECVSLKMRKAMIKKLKQKKLRGNEKVADLLKTDVLKRSRKNGFISKVKQKSVGKVKVVKIAKLTNKVNKKAINETMVKEANETEGLDRVLGMRRSPDGVYEFLVEWCNGTSCWVTSEEVVKDKHNYYLREYLVESGQDVSVVNRVPFQAYCCDSLSLKECKPTRKTKTYLKKMLCVEETMHKTVCKLPINSPKQKEDIIVEYEENYCCIKLNRETCKRKSTSLRIMADLITALENAATSDCELVIIRGLHGNVLCGLKLHDMAMAGTEKGNGILSQARYLLQTLTSYPKPLVALISRSAEGIGAVFLSLFDMICDEETWDKKQILAPCQEESKSLYTLPRLSGHSLLSEEILMGKHIEDSVISNPISSSNKPFLNETSTVTRTLVEIEASLRLLGKKTLLQANEKISELFPVAKPSFALFADIKNGLSYECESSRCLNEAVVETIEAEKSLSTVYTTVDYETSVNCARMNDRGYEGSTDCSLSSECPHAISELYACTSQSTDDIPTNSTISDQVNILEQTCTQCNDGAIVDRQTIKHAKLVQHFNNNMLTIDHMMPHESASDTTYPSTVNNTISGLVTSERVTTSAMNRTIVQSSDADLMDQEAHETLHSNVGDQTNATKMQTTGDNTAVESKLVNTVSDHNIWNVVCIETTPNVAERTNDGVLNAPLDVNCHDIGSHNSTLESCSNHNGGNTKHEKKNSVDSKMMSNSTECTSSGVDMVSTNNTESVVNNYSTCWTEVGSNVSKLITDVIDSMADHVNTNHNCSQNADDTSGWNTSRIDTTKHCIGGNNVENSGITFGNCDMSNGDNWKPNSPIDLKSETAEDDLGETCNSENKKKELVWTSTAEHDVSDQGFSNSAENINTTSQTFEKRKANERISNDKLITINDIDVDNTNDLNTINSCAEDHLEHHTNTILEISSTNGTELSSLTNSSADALDRYIRKLEAEIEAEKMKAEQYIEKISRLWDNPFLCQNK